MLGPQTKGLRQPLHLSIDPSPYRDSTSSSAESSFSPVISNRSSVPKTLVSLSKNTIYSVIPDDDWRICSVISLWDFRSEDPDHLNFRRGDVLDIVKQEDTGWWAAVPRGGNHVGWIPASFVQVLAEEAAQTMANVDKELLIWSPGDEARPTGPIRRNSDYTNRESASTRNWEVWDSEEDVDPYRRGTHNGTYTDGSRQDAPWITSAISIPPVDRTSEVDTREEASSERRGLPSPPQSRTAPLQFNKPTPPTPVSPPASTNLFHIRSETTTNIISSLYRRQPIFMTPGTVPVGLRSEGVPAPPRLAPVNESISSDMSNETDTADEVVLVPRNPRPEKVRNLTGDDNAFKFVETKTTPSTPSWYLKAQYAEEELKIEFDGSIKLGTLRALVEQLTGEFTNTQQDKSFRNVFFLTFRTFATADEIFSMLVGRYELPPPEGISIQEIDEWRERKLRPTQNRVLMCLTTWLEDYSMLNEDPHVARQMQEFLSLIQQPPQLALAARLILESLSRLTFASPSSNGAMPSPATKKKRMRMNKGDLLRMDPGIIAQHLTLLESKLYMRIKSQECLNWAKVQTGRTVTNLYAFSSTHDKLAKWVKLSVLSNDGLGKRADTVDFWIKVAEKCRISSNYSSMSAIVAGLVSTVISRLHLTWAHVSRANQLEILSKMNEPAGNFSAWRSLLSTVDGPCVPFIGMYLTDIVHCNDQFPDTTVGVPGQPFIHFQKRMKWAEAVTAIVRHQAKPFFLPEDPVTMTYIDGQLAAANAKELPAFWTRSQELQQAELAHADIRKGLEAAGF